MSSESPNRRAISLGLLQTDTRFRLLTLWDRTVYAGNGGFPMEGLTITLFEPLRHRVERQAAAAGFESAEEFVRELVERELRRGDERERLEALALAGLASGEMIEMDDAWWDETSAEFERRFGPAE